MDKPEGDLQLDQEDILIGQNREALNEARRDSVKEALEEEPEEGEDAEENTTGAVAISQESGPQRIPPCTRRPPFLDILGSAHPSSAPLPPL